MMSFREQQRQYPPACSHCMTHQWQAFEAMWEIWICQVCEMWTEPYERLEFAQPITLLRQEEPISIWQESQ